jgi:hypothetical protein
LRVDAAEFEVNAADWICAKVVTSAGQAEGCHPVPDETGRFEGQPLRPSFTLLGSDRFFRIVAPNGVTGMEVRVKGAVEATEARSIDAGSGRKLLVAVLGGPPVTSNDPTSSRDYEVRLIGRNGESVREFVMSDLH